MPPAGSGQQTRHRPGSAPEDNSLKMLENYDLFDKIKTEFGEKVACISIGPAGEMKLAAVSAACSEDMKH